MFITKANYNKSRYFLNKIWIEKNKYEIKLNQIPISN